MNQHRRYVALYVVIILGIGSLVSIQPVVMQRTSLLIYQLNQFWDMPYGHILSAALYQLQRHLLFGIGVNQFLHLCPSEIAGPSADYCFVHPHNFYMQWLVETGVVGLAILVAFLSSLLLTAFRICQQIEERNKLSLYIAVGTLVGFLFPLVGAQNNFSNWPASIYWYSLALTMSIMALHRIKKTL